MIRELCQPPTDSQAQAAYVANAEVREHIADNICSLAPVLGRDATKNELLPMIKGFFADESIEIRRKVRLSVLSCLFMYVCVCPCLMRTMEVTALSE